MHSQEAAELIEALQLRESLRPVLQFLGRWHPLPHKIKNLMEVSGAQCSRCVCSSALVPLGTRVAVPAGGGGGRAAEPVGGGRRGGVAGGAAAARRRAGSLRGDHVGPQASYLTQVIVLK